MGAVPFVVTGCIPNPVDALFETVSGFTTTGASILPAVEDLPKGTHTVTYGTRPFNWVLLAFTLALGAVLFALAWRKVQDETC